MVRRKYLASFDYQGESLHVQNEELDPRSCVLLMFCRLWVEFGEIWAFNVQTASVCGYIWYHFCFIHYELLIMIGKFNKYEGEM